VHSLFFRNIIYLAVSCGSLNAWAWGSYGHEQVNDAAVRLIASPYFTPEQKTDKKLVDILKEKKSFAGCIGRNRDYLVRLAITPDYEWKRLFAIWRKLPSQDLKKKVSENDLYEHKLHYFEPDAYLAETISAENVLQLPVGEYSSSVVEKYRSILSARKGSEATVKEVFNIGTLPWRVAQLYDLAVKAIKENDVRRALFYMGVMGHYVGDSSQPLHATKNYDGQLSEPPLAGIHSAFETRMLDERTKEFKLSVDRILKECKAQNLPESECSPEEAYTRLSTGVGWLSFAGTSSRTHGVSYYTNRSYKVDAATLKREELVKEIVQLIGGGSLYVGPIMKAFSEEIEKFKAEKTAKAKKKTDKAVAKSMKSKTGRDVAQVTSPAEAAARETSSYISSEVIRRVAEHSEPDPLGEKELKIRWIANKRMAAGGTLLARIWDSIYEASGRPQLTSQSCGKYSFDLAEAIKTYPKPDYFPQLETLRASAEH
jgi:hypothetical protein